MNIPLPDGVTDQRESFARRFAALQQDRAHPELAHPAVGSPRVTLVVPGLLGDSFRALVAPFICSREWLNERGYDVRVAWLNGRRGAQANAKRLRDRVEQASDESGAAVHLIGYSKGCADALHMLGEYPETHGAVRSLVSLAGVVRGTPLASRRAPFLDWLLRYLPLPGLGFGDGLALRDLSYSVRLAWLAEHALPRTVRYGSILAVPDAERVSRILVGGWERLAKLDPRNDSQVLAPDSMLPAGELLAVLNADHWAVALPIEERMPWVARTLVTRNDFPRRALLRAIIDHMDAPSEHPAPDEAP